MRRLSLLLVALLGNLTVLATPPEAPQVEALYALRLNDPPAFIAGVHRLEALPPPVDPRTRDTLRLLGAHARALEARYDEAMHLALPLADAAATPELRLRAAALIVNVLAGTRDFLEGQKRLEPLLADIDSSPDASLRRHVHLVAAVFYNELGQHDLALRHAERVLDDQPDLVERCAASLQTLEARQNDALQRLDANAFSEAIAHCDEAGSLLVRGFVDVRQARWLTLRGEAAEAVRQLQERLPLIEGTGYPMLRAEANAQLAESLLRAGRLDEAEAATDAALSLSARLPTGLPLLQARRTRYEIALARGDEARALRELQAVITAERAYLDELQRLQEAYHAGRSEALARQQALALLDERNAQLRLEAEGDARATTRLYLLLALAGMGLFALLAWAWHSRRQQWRHRRLMQVDALTGLWTRQHFTQQAAAALAVSERLAQPMALVLFDLDHFSSINARHGHLSGDRLLATVGACLRGLEAPGLHFGRLGGEEFAVLMPGAGLDEGLGFAERCRQAIAQASAVAIDENAVMTITASFGVVSTTAAGYGLRDLLANADQALYRAKSAGRNRAAAAVVVPVADAAA